MLGRRRIDEFGVAWERYEGPFDRCAVGSGYRLLDKDRRTKDHEFFEDMLYTAAVSAGWLTGNPDELAEVADVRITIAVARRNPRWEAHVAASSSIAGMSLSAATGPEETDQPAPTALAIEARELLARALEVAARFGDPNPELIQHAYGSRFELTRTTGSIDFSGAPSCMVVMKGNFRAPRPRPPRHEPSDDEEFFSYPFQTFVIDLETGKITDSGSSTTSPDLASLPEVVTDHAPVD
jgi:hypothetical protein